MELLQERPLDCPFCGAAITVLVDCSLRQQEYVEDCEVCCRPLVLTVRVHSAHDIEIHACFENA